MEASVKHLKKSHKQMLSAHIEFSCFRFQKITLTAESARLAFCEACAELDSVFSNGKEKEKLQITD